MYNNDDDGACSSNQQSEKDAFTIFACQNCIFLLNSKLHKPK